MQYSDRDLFLRWWGDAWEIGNWSAAWSKAIGGLTAEEAAWRAPNAPGVVGERRKSIWQMVEHMVFWRENVLARMEGVAAPTDEARASGNWPEIGDRSEAAWADARRRFEDSYRRIGEAVRERYEVAAPAMWLLPHDSYHVGQICFVRAMLGKAPVE